MFRVSAIDKRAVLAKRQSVGCKKGARGEARDQLPTSSSDATTRSGTGRPVGPKSNKRVTCSRRRNEQLRSFRTVQLLKTPISYENKTNSSRNFDRSGEFHGICGDGSAAFWLNGNAILVCATDGAASANDDIRDTSVSERR